MKNWKSWRIIAFVILCIALNCGGRLAASAFSLPVWLDSLGTVLCATAGGPFCGAITGMTSNLIYSMMYHGVYGYALTSIMLGIVVGMAAEKHALDTLFGTVSVSALTSVLSVAISVPLNLLYYGGATGNLWGDGVANFLRELGYNHILAGIIGQFYVDFVDKVLTLVLLFLLLRIARRVRRNRTAGEDGTGDGEDQDGSGSGENPGGTGSGSAAVLLVLLLIGVTALSARNASASDEEEIVYSDYVQTVYNHTNGLPCGEANDIVQTNDGILWVGTYAGLYRYNGTEFRRMDYDSVRNVNSLFVDAEGRLWIGTNDNGLSIAINEKIVNVLDKTHGLPSNSVRCITQGSDGNYYIGTTGSLMVLSLRSGLKKVASFFEIHNTRTIAADSEGHVAAVTSNGRLFLLKDGQIRSSLRLTEGEELFNSCGFDESGLLMAGSNENHIYLYDISGERFRPAGEIVCEGMASLNDFYPLDNGDILVSADNGVGYLDGKRVFHGININDFNNSIDRIAVDYQGNFWFTSSRLGLLRLCRSPFRDVYGTVGLEEKVVNAVAKWRDSIYFGTDRGLDIVDESCRKKERSELGASFSDMRIRCLTADSAGNLWICTYGRGLFRIDPDGDHISYNAENSGLGNKVRLAKELSDGSIAAAGEGGFVIIRDGEVTNQFSYSEGGIGTIVLTLAELADGTLLAGTDGDGIAILRDGRFAGKLTTRDGLSSDVILRIVPDKKGDGVFVVTSNGLCYMEDLETVRPLENFPYFNNYDIWSDDGEKLFITGSAGIYVVDREELLADSESMRCELLDSRRGLGSTLTANSWNYDDGKGKLFLPCDSGVYIIDTKRYESGNWSYRMLISELRLDNVPCHVERSSPIRIGRGTGRIELYPEVINYTVEDPYVGYYLEGFEKDWNIASQRSMSTVSYTNLPMGEYTFHLAVFDADQEDILEERTYTLIKEKEIYDNRYFKLYMLFVAMAAVAWFTWFVVRTQVQRTLNVQRRELEVARHKLQMGNETIMAIAKAVDAKDVRTSQHSYRVSEYSYMIGKELGLSEKECINLRNAARMHDIGKIGIPDAILNKPAKLTDEEYAIMKSHTTQGAEILKDFTLIDNVVEGARYHHERYDGRGYPSGLAGEDIPLYGRIIGVADAFDAMTANRVYRKKMDFDYVLGEMERCSGTQFDPQMVEILLKLIREGKINIKELYGELANNPEEKA